uniref:Uncharacterized protein n=1 Tax=Strongyloides papillosus TaxID=174720 RepID=A0A0N5BSG3_STREA
MNDNINQEDYSFELDFFASKCQIIAQKFVTNMMGFEERGCFTKLSEIYKKKTNEIEECYQDVKNISIILCHYVPIYELVSETSNQIQYLLNTGRIEGDGNLLEYRDFS